MHDIARARIKETLPPILHEIAEIAGLEAALTLALQSGGRRIRIPRHPRNSNLAKLVGVKEAELLSQKMCYMYFEIPQAKPSCTLWLRSQGKSIEDIAVILKTTRRSVHNWLSKNNS